MNSELVRGKAFVLGDDIDTDQIIPAQYLVYNLDDPEERKNYGKFALAGVPSEQSGLPFGNIQLTDPTSGASQFSIIVAGKNFGCGSSREHAPVALQMAGIKAVIARSYARIFYRNAVDGAYVIPFESRESLHQIIKTGDELQIHVSDATLIHHDGTSRTTYRLQELGDVKHILFAGGLFEYARKSGMLLRHTSY